MNNPFLNVRDVIKEYPQGDTPLRVLKGISLDIREAEYLIIVGTSGAGKSTLLHIMGLLDKPTSGAIWFEGLNLTELPELEQSKLRNRLFGFVFQFFHLLPDFNALENVMMPAVVGAGVMGWRGQRAAIREHARQLLSQVGLAERVKHRPAQLSGGERQRVALCRALINKPRVLLLDEPTGNLDSKTGEQIHDLVHKLNTEHRQTVVMVTHNDAAVQRASRVIRLKDGEVVGGG